MTKSELTELHARLNYFEDLLVEIQRKLNNPDYNISLTIPKPADCVGKCHPDTTIPWE